MYKTSVILNSMTLYSPSRRNGLPLSFLAFILLGSLAQLASGCLPVYGEQVFTLEGEVRDANAFPVENCTVYVFREYDLSSPYDVPSYVVSSEFEIEVFVEPGVEIFVEVLCPGFDKSRSAPFVIDDDLWRKGRLNLGRIIIQ